MLKIAAIGRYTSALADTPVDLRALLHRESNCSVRRINRFTELSLIGALRCRSAPIAADAALYLAAESPMLADCVRALRSTLIEKRPPTPFEFMNISGNMAGFYVAQQLGIEGPQLAVARRHTSLEAALELLALPNRAHRHAVLGCVEEGVWPLAEQRARFSLAADATLQETSHWFHIDADCEQPLCAVAATQRHATRDALDAALAQLPPGTQLAWHPRLTTRVESATFTVLPDIEFIGQGTAAEALHRYILTPDRAPWCHVNRGEDGAYLLLRASKP